MHWLHKSCHYIQPVMQFPLWVAHLVVCQSLPSCTCNTNGIHKGTLTLTLSLSLSLSLSSFLLVPSYKNTPKRRILATALIPPLQVLNNNIQFHIPPEMNVSTKISDKVRHSKYRTVHVHVMHMYMYSTCTQ